MATKTSTRFLKFRMDLQELDLKINQYELLSERVTSPAGINLSGMPRNQNPTNRMEYMIHKRIALNEDIQRLKKWLEVEESELKELLEDLNPIEQFVLESQFFICSEWKETAKVIFGKYPDFILNCEEYIQKLRQVQSRAFRKLDLLQKQPPKTEKQLKLEV